MIKTDRFVCWNLLAEWLTFLIKRRSNIRNRYFQHIFAIVNVVLPQCLKIRTLPISFFCILLHIRIDTGPWSPYRSAFSDGDNTCFRTRFLIVQFEESMECESLFVSIIRTTHWISHLLRMENFLWRRLPSNGKRMGTFSKRHLKFSKY
jgi:hypothetical protein